MLTSLMAIILASSQMGCSKKSSSTSTNTGSGSTITCTGTPPTFNATVLPLITARCSTNSGCHASGSTNSGGPLTNYAQINARSSNIKSQVSSGAMPQGSTLTTAEKSTIVCWINNGAINN